MFICCEYDSSYSIVDAIGHSDACDCKAHNRKCLCSYYWYFGHGLFSFCKWGRRCSCCKEPFEMSWDKSRAGALSFVFSFLLLFELTLDPFFFFHGRIVLWWSIGGLTGL